MSWKTEPVLIIICPHFWRKEWWYQRYCRNCHTWLHALINGRVNETTKE